MAEHSLIEWTDATWNPITGCSVVSPGCTNCYAMKLAGARLKHHPSREGLTRDSKAGPVWTGEVRFNEQWLDQPLRWTKPRRIFVCAHGDLFAENVPDAWIVGVVSVSIASWLLHGHTLQILTKRASRMRLLINDPVFWEAVNILVEDLVLDWVIVGGESGQGARPVHPDWVRSLRDQCSRAGTAFFFKQWGEWAVFYDRDAEDPDWRRVPDVDHQMGRGAERWHNLAGGIGFHGERLVAVRNVGKKAAGRILDGAQHNAMPEPRP